MIQNNAELLEILNAEIQRVKIWANENCFHNGTAINHIIRQYRHELKKLVNIISDDLRDNLVSYRDVENDFFIMRDQDEKLL
jgi:hypothetical protein